MTAESTGRGEADTRGRNGDGRSRLVAFSIGWTLLLLLLAPSAGGVTTLPPDFTQEVLASGLNTPTAFAFLPDGRILIAEKAGLVKVLKNGTVLSTPFLDIRSRVNSRGNRGLLGIAPDPSFALNGYLYVYYAYENDASRPAGPKTGRVGRFTASGDTASPSSEVVILGTTVGNSCNNFPAGRDCIPADRNHMGGTIAFAADGTMFISTGDGAFSSTVDDNALRSQDLESLAGKILHVTTSGAGLPSNPFWDGNASANRSKVWVYGLRNPFRFRLRPSGDLPYVGDVGWNNWEEINVATPGANLGWPCYEGPNRQPGYEPKAICQALYAQGTSAVKFPLLSYNHGDFGGSASVTGGPFHTGTAFPAPYRGAYFYGDYVNSFIRYLEVDAADTLVSGPATFATGADGPVDIQLGSDGALYYLAINAGELRRIRYSPANRPPDAVAAGNPTSGAAPLDVQFSSVGSSDPDGDSLTFSWSFGDGTSISTEASPQHRYETNGAYMATLTVSDGKGGTDTATVAVEVGQPPTATITEPTSALRYRVGDVITFSGSADDPDGSPFPGSALSWEIILHHCPGGACHTHPWGTASGSSGNFTVGDEGDETFFELILTATDADGLTGTDSVTIQPQTVAITLATDPSGLQVVYDGTSETAPFTKTTIVGSRHTISTPSPQGNNVFASWSDGGAQQHIVTMAASDATYTATFDQAGAASSPLFLSLLSPTTVGGVAAENEDVLFFNGSTFSLAFDGSDVGFTALRIDAFSFLDSTRLLLSFDTPTTLSGIAGTVDDSDVVLFTATSPFGPNTAGILSMYFDGGDVGLTTAGEDVDAVEALPSGGILISTLNTVAVTGLAGEDEDLLQFAPTQLGPTTSGTFSLYFEGSDVALTASGEDVDAAAVDGAEKIYLSTFNNFSVTGVSGADEDVFVFTPSTLGATTTGSFSSTRYFDGSVHGLAGNDVVAIDLP